MPSLLFLSGRAAPDRPARHAAFNALPDAQLTNELRRLQGTPLFVLDSPELAELVLPTVRADFSVVETYIYQEEAALPCGISAFGGVDDPRVTAEELAAWSRHTTGHFSVRRFPGGHFYPQTSTGPLLHAITQDLGRVLETDLTRG